MNEAGWLNCADSFELRQHGLSFFETINQKLLITASIQITDSALSILAKLYGSLTCHSEDPFYSIDSVKMRFNGQEQTLHTDEYFSRSLVIFKHPDIRYEDYNFDGLADISIHSSLSGTKNQLRTYFLYDSFLDRFELSDTLSKLSNLSLDLEQKVIRSAWLGGHASKIFTFSTYQNRDGDLIEIEQIKQDYYIKINGYVRVKKMLLDDGSWLVDQDTIPME